jgi:hypothetical protein
MGTASSLQWILPMPMCKYNTNTLLHPPHCPSHRHLSPDNTTHCTAALFLNAAAHHPCMVCCTTSSPLPPPPCLARPPLLPQDCPTHCSAPSNAAACKRVVRCTATHPPTTPPDAPPCPPKTPQPPHHAACHAAHPPPSSPLPPPLSPLPSPPSPLPPPPSPQVNCQVPPLRHQRACANAVTMPPPTNVPMPTTKQHYPAKPCCRAATTIPTMPQR